MARRDRIAAAGASLLALLVACSGEKKKDGETGGGPVAAAAEPDDPAPAPDTSILPLGVSDPADFNYVWGKGARAYRPVAAALKKQDWRAVRSAAEETLELDPGHLDAHRVLASALAQHGEYEEALEHLKIALAGDWTRWGGSVESDPDLEPLLSSPLGAALREMNARYREELIRRARAGLLVVARRSRFKPVAAGQKRARLSSRAEAFVYDRELDRYLRLTQTGFQVVAALPSPSGDEVAYVTVSRVTTGAPGAAPPVLAELRVGAVSLADPAARAAEAKLTGARTLALEYLAGDELVATVIAPGATVWGEGAASSFTIDKATGKTRPARPTAPGGRRLLVRYEGVEIDGAGDAEGIAADWTPEGGTAEEFVLAASNKRVRLPRGEAARRASVAWSPDRRRLALATAADPCAEAPADRQAALYLVDVESGKLEHVTRARSWFMPRFLDANLLVFEDDEGRVRFHDAAAGRDSGSLAPRGGIGLHGLGAEQGAICTRDGAAAQPVPAGAVPAGTAPREQPAGEAGSESAGGGEENGAGEVEIMTGD